jgi:sec-independent protein translocase protein TatC
MTVLEHLGELKRRLIRVGIVFLIFTVTAFVFYQELFEFLRRPAEEALANSDGDIVFGRIAEAWSATAKVAVIVGFSAALPFFLFELTMFLRPGLTPREQKYLYLLLPGGTLSFAAGVWFGFEIILPPAVNFLLTFGSELATPLISIDSYVTLLISLMMWMGMIFELPIVMFFLAKLGVVGYRWFSKQRRWAVLFAFVLGAIITPTFDPATQSLVAGPVIVLYEAGIWLSRLAERGRQEAPLAEGPVGGSE